MQAGPPQWPQSKRNCPFAVLGFYAGLKPRRPNKSPALYQPAGTRTHWMPMASVRVALKWNTNPAKRNCSSGLVAVATRRRRKGLRTIPLWNESESAGTYVVYLDLPRVGRVRSVDTAVRGAHLMAEALVDPLKASDVGALVAGFAFAMATLCWCVSCGRKEGLP
jgi:hypothetical protein